MTLTLDRMSRLVVPKALRDRFALKPGDQLEVTCDAEGIRLHRVVPAPALTQENGILVCASEVPVSGWDIGSFLEDQRTQRSTSLGGI